MMRTTLNLPDDLYEIVRGIAAARRISVGQAVAELARKGLQPVPRLQTGTAFPCFSIPQGAPPITLKQTLEAEDDV